MFHLKNDPADDTGGTITMATASQNEPPIKEVCSWEAVTSDIKRTELSIASCFNNGTDNNGDMEESDVYPYTSTCIKQELDIGPTELRPYDIQYMLLPCKPEPDGGTSRSNRNMGGSRKSLLPCEEARPQQLSGDLLTCDAPNTQLTERKYQNSAITEPAHTDGLIQVMVTYTEQLTQATGAPAPQNTSHREDTNDAPSTSRTSSRSNRSLNAVCEDISTKFQCDYCHKIFMWKFMLLAHMAAHNRMFTNKSKFQCATCEKFLPSKGDLVVHLRVHTKERPFQCTVCHKSFSRRNGANVHMRVHTKERPYQCDFCKKTFRNKDSLIVHIRVHTKELPFPCLLCENRFLTRPLLTSHLRVHTKEQPNQCSTCGKICSSLISLTTHVRIHTKEQPYQCPICGKTSSTRGNLASHVRRHARTIKCTICDITFSLPSALKFHLREHSYMPYQCTACDKKFMRRTSLRRHEHTHTGGIKPVYRCELCKETKTLSRVLKIHVGVISKEFPYECKKCKKGPRPVMRPKRKRRIIQRTMRKKEYQCDICNKILSHRSTLIRHLEIHTSERPYSCTVCSQTFLVKCSLVRHMKVHTNERPYQCAVCKETFKMKYHVTRHMKVHNK